MRAHSETRWRGVLRCGLGLLLAWAALPKLANPQEFYGYILAYDLSLPDFFLRLIAIALPWLELMCGLMLVAKLWVRAVLLLVTLLFVVFAVVTGQALMRGLNISCGCFKLSWSGLEAASSLEKMFESVGFAFFRAVFLTTITLFLFRRTFVRVTPEN